MKRKKKTNYNAGLALVVVVVVVALVSGKAGEMIGSLTPPEEGSALAICLQGCRDQHAEDEAYCFEVHEEGEDQDECLGWADESLFSCEDGCEADHGSAPEEDEDPSEGEEEEMEEESDPEEEEYEENMEDDDSWWDNLWEWIFE